MDKVLAGRLFNKLSRTNVPGVLGGMYVGIAHDDVLHDLRQDTAVGGWTDVSKYADPQSVLRGEVGMFGGVRWLRSSNVTLTSSTLAYTSKVNVCGFNALGYAESLAPQVKITGPFDKMGRFLNIGWYGVFVFDTIDANNQTQAICASSINSA
jgi:N4-gp56 family major capsid protein